MNRISQICGLLVAGAGATLGCSNITIAVDAENTGASSDDAGSLGDGGEDNPDSGAGGENSSESDSGSKDTPDSGADVVPNPGGNDAVGRDSGAGGTPGTGGMGGSDTPVMPGSGGTSGVAGGAGEGGTTGGTGGGGAAGTSSGMAGGGGTSGAGGNPGCTWEDEEFDATELSSCWQTYDADAFAAGPELVDGKLRVEPSGETKWTRHGVGVLADAPAVFRTVEHQRFILESRVAVFSLQSQDERPQGWGSGAGVLLQDRDASLVDGDHYNVAFRVAGPTANSASSQVTNEIKSHEELKDSSGLSGFLRICVTDSVVQTYFRNTESAAWTSIQSYDTSLHIYPALRPPVTVALTAFNPHLQRDTVAEFTYVRVRPIATPDECLLDIAAP